MPLRLKFNLETEDIEFVNDQDKVVDNVGPEVVQSWVAAYNDKHGYEKPEVKAEEVTEPESVVADEKQDEEVVQES